MAEDALIRLGHGQPIRFGAGGTQGVVRDPSTGDLRIVDVIDTKANRYWSPTRTPPPLPPPSRCPRWPTQGDLAVLLAGADTWTVRG